MRWCDVLQLHAVDLYAPFVCGVVEHGAQLGVDGVARGERLVQLKLADDVAQGGLRELLYCVGQVVNLVHGLERVDNLEVQQGVYLRLHVVFGYNVLLVEVVHLFAQVDGVGVEVTAVAHGNYGLGLVDKGHNNVHPGLQCGLVAAQTFYYHRFALRHDGYALRDYYHSQEHKGYQYVNHCF